MLDVSSPKLSILPATLLLSVNDPCTIGGIVGWSNEPSAPYNIVLVVSAPKMISVRHL